MNKDQVQLIRYVNAFFIGTSVTTIGAFFTNSDSHIITLGIILFGGLVATIAWFLYLRSSLEIVKERHETVINTIEGSETHPVLRFTGIPNGKEMYYTLNLANAKSKPLYDVWVMFHDPEEVERSCENGLPTLKTLDLYKRENLGNIPPNFHFPLCEPQKLPEKGYFHYFSYLGTRNGIYHQEIYLFPNEKGWEIKQILTKYVEGEKERKVLIDDRSIEDKTDLSWILK